MSLTTRAVWTAVVATLVAVAAYLGERPLAVLCALLAVVVAFGWPVLLGLSSRPGASVVIGIGGVGAVAAITFTRGEPFLRELPAVVALSILLAFVNELLRTDGRERLMESVSGVVAGTLVVTSVAGWIAAGRTSGGTGLVITGALALAVGSVVAVLPVSGWGGAFVTVGVAAGAGAGAGALVPGVDAVAGALLGLAVGVLVASLHVLFDRLKALRKRPAALAALVLPVTITGILVYVVGRVLVG
ncbi:MAG: hypothetical protein ACYCTH_04015 [Cellulomonas sp.]